MKAHQKKSSKDVVATTFRFDPELYAEMQAAAKARRCSLSMLAHDALRAMLEANASQPTALLSALAASRRDPLLTVTDTRHEVYHGRLDRKRWPKAQQAGLLPFRLVFKKERMHRGAALEVEYDLPLALVTSVFEDPTGAVAARRETVNAKVASGLNRLAEQEEDAKAWRALDEAATDVPALKAYLTSLLDADGTLGPYRCGAARVLPFTILTTAGRVSRRAATVLLGTVMRVMVAHPMEQGGGVHPFLLAARVAQQFSGEDFEVGLHLVSSQISVEDMEEQGRLDAKKFGLAARLRLLGGLVVETIESHANPNC